MRRDPVREVTGVGEPPSQIDGAAQDNRVVGARVTHLGGLKNIDDSVTGQALPQRQRDAGRDLVGGAVSAGAADKNPHGRRSILLILPGWGGAGGYLNALSSAS